MSMVLEQHKRLVFFLRKLAGVFHALIIILPNDADIYCHQTLRHTYSSVGKYRFRIWLVGYPSKDMDGTSNSIDVEGTRKI
jgi:hypothetical protein